MVNNTRCLTTTLFVTRVVVGDLKKSLVLSIQIREPRQKGTRRMALTCVAVMQLSRSNLVRLFSLYCQPCIKSTQVFCSVAVIR